jgi:hypothetical protein
MELEEKYTKPALHLVEKVAKAGHTIVWGGSKKGLMHQVADTARNFGGKLVGISMERFRDVAYHDADELVIVKSLGERKFMLLDRSDAVVVLVGGIGTLDEATEVLELRKHGAHSKPIIFLNTDNFYEGLHMQLQRMQNDGFLPTDFKGLAHFANTPEEAMRHLAS